MAERGANAEWLVGPEATPLGEDLKTSYRKEDCFVCLMYVFICIRELMSSLSFAFLFSKQVVGG